MPNPLSQQKFCLTLNILKAIAIVQMKNESGLCPWEHIEKFQK